MKRLSHIILSVLAVLLSACDDAPRRPDTGPLAMEAWIDNDGYPVVVLTQSLEPSVDEIDASLAMVRWGKVTITDGVDTVVMTGGADKTVFPPYSYRTYAMQGEVGRTYTVIGEYEGKRITATATIPTPPEIEDVTFERIAGSDTLCSARVRFSRADSENIGRYVLFTRVRNRETRHYPSMLGAVTMMPGESTVDVPLYRGTNVLDDFQANFVTGDTVDVIVAHVEDVVYRFWDGYQNAVYFGNNVFLSSSTSLPTNVVGGYGIFSARGIDRRVVTAP